MARERLTSRARQAADDKAPYPGSINQEGRAEEQRGSMTYRTFEPSVANHERTDYTRVHGVSDQRNEMGFGIPDPASGMLVASNEYQAKCIKASELAETFLGPKVSDRMLLAQARDFLSMSDEVLDRTLERFNRTDSLYIAREDYDEEQGEVSGEQDTGPDEYDEEDAASAADENAEADANNEEEAVEKVEIEVETPVEPVADADPERVGEQEPQPKGIEETPEAPPVVDLETTPDDTPEEEATDNPARDIPDMPPGQAASPQVNSPSAGSMSPEAAAPDAETVAEETEEAMVMSEDRAANLAQLAACTLSPEQYSEENIVKQAKKFASLDDEQIQTLLAGYGKTAQMPSNGAIDTAPEVAVAEEDEEKETDKACVTAEGKDSDVEVASVQEIDVGSFDLSDDYYDGPVTATDEEMAELNSIFDDEQTQIPAAMDPAQALTASIAQLSGQSRSKVASKVGVKSLGNVTLQSPQANPKDEVSELEGLWNSPNEFPGGGF